jgi:hypothetical protein
MQYLNQIKFDDMPHWNEEELSFYNRKSFAMTTDSSREEIFQKVKQTLQHSSEFNERFRGLFSGGFKEFNLWQSIVQSRAHSVKME